MPKMSCPRCHAQDYVKNGKNYGKQRYKCLACKYNFTVSRLGKGIDNYYVRLCLRLYLEGLGFRSIERIVGAGHASVMNWVKKYGKTLETLGDASKTAPIKVAEVDEPHSYIGSKKPLMGLDCFGQGR